MKSLLEKIATTCAITAALVSSVAASADEAPGCVMDPDEVAMNIDSGNEPVLLLASSHGAFGFSCDTVKSLVGDIEVLEASLIPAFAVASRNPRVADLILRGVNALVKDPYVLAVVVSGVIGTRTIYFNLNKSRAECEQESEREKMELMIEQKLKVHPKYPIEIQFKNGGF